MQRAADMGLLGSFPPAVRAPVVRAQRATPAPVAAVAQRKATTPARRPMRAPQESRPAGAVMAHRGGFSGVLGRLHDGDPLLLAHLRRNPAEARRLAAHLDRLLSAC